MQIIALVVTYNRKELLKECLNALMRQTRKLDRIVVVDNASTDGTIELFYGDGIFSNRGIEYKRVSVNSGGAGGFYAGIKYCSQLGEWIWLMDDDTIPTNTALENLCLAMKKLEDEKISFLASKVIGPNGEPMNLPTIDSRAGTNGYSDWYMYLDEGIVKIRTATFVSLLLNCDAVKEIGYPIPWYFIWGDDTEYTLRATQNFGNAFLVGASLVVHKRFNAKQISVWTDDNLNRLKMYHYYVRNQLNNEKIYGSRLGVLKQIITFEIKCIRCIFSKMPYKRKRICTVNKGILEYILKIYNKKMKNIEFI